MHKTPSSNLVGKSCPYCQTPIKPGAMVQVCDSCHIPHHIECWQDNGGCTTFGCSAHAGTSAIEENGYQLNQNVERRTYNLRRLAAILALLAIIICIALTQIGFYTIQPIGALPKGVTLLVWRSQDEPFFNSPDRLCIDKTGGVSIMGRLIALSAAPKDRIILRLPYWKFAYLRSTYGKEYDL